jgi:hypothetical protein
MSPSTCVWSSIAGHRRRSGSQGDPGPWERTAGRRVDDRRIIAYIFWLELRPSGPPTSLGRLRDSKTCTPSGRTGNTFSIRFGNEDTLTERSRTGSDPSM